MFILDTNVISELRKISSNKCDRNVANWAQDKDVTDFFISVITIMELEIGVSLKEKKDLKQGAMLRFWFNNNVLSEFKERILMINTKIALRCAKLHALNPASERDALIAATALVQGMTVVTRNIKDFTYFNVALINPFEN